MTVPTGVSPGLRSAGAVVCAVFSGVLSAIGAISRFLSSSEIVTVSLAVLIAPFETAEIVPITVSSPSTAASSITSTATVAVVLPAGITTVVVPSAPVRL